MVLLFYSKHDLKTLGAFSFSGKLVTYLRSIFIHPIAGLLFNSTAVAGISRSNAIVRVLFSSRQVSSAVILFLRTAPFMLFPMVQSSFWNIKFLGNSKVGDSGIR